MATLIQLLGFTLSLCNEAILEKLISLLAKSFLFFPSNRKATLISNLQYAFPSWNKSKIRCVAAESTERMLEMGFFSIIYPFWGNDKRRRATYFCKSTEIALKELRKKQSPVLFVVPHVSLFETLATTPLFRPYDGMKLGAIFRPNRNRGLDNWIDRSRKLTGLVTFSRKEGLLKAKSFLKKGNWLVVLYDQNAGDRGVLDFFLNRFKSLRGKS